MNSSVSLGSREFNPYSLVSFALRARYAAKAPRVGRSLVGPQGALWRDRLPSERNPDRESGPRHRASAVFSGHPCPGAVGPIVAPCPACPALARVVSEMTPFRRAGAVPALVPGSALRSAGHPCPRHPCRPGVRPPRRPCRGSIKSCRRTRCWSFNLGLSPRTRPGAAAIHGKFRRASCPATVPPVMVETNTFSKSSWLIVSNKHPSPYHRST